MELSVHAIDSSLLIFIKSKVKPCMHTRHAYNSLYTREDLWLHAKIGFKDIKRVHKIVILVLIERRLIKTKLNYVGEH